MPQEIQCVTQDRGEVVAVGGKGWSMTVAQAIAAVESGERRFFVSVNGQQAMVTVEKGPDGKKSLATALDDGRCLLRLPDCSRG